MLLRRTFKEVTFQLRCGRTEPNYSIQKLHSYLLNLLLGATTLLEP